MRTMVKLLVWAVACFGTIWGGSNLIGFSGQTPWQAQIVSVGQTPTFPAVTVASDGERIQEIALTEKLVGRTLDFGSWMFLGCLFGVGTLTGMALKGKRVVLPH